VALTELQSAIINAMMDDYEDVEQVYLGINRECLETTNEPTYGQPKWRLVDMVDEMLRMWEDGLISAHTLSTEGAAPLNRIDHAGIHNYWFAPTEKGKAEWKGCRR
jgi:hypothetical protein